MSSYLRCSKHWPKAVINTCAKLVAKPPEITSANSTKLVKPLPLNTSLVAAERTLKVPVGLINCFDVHDDVRSKGGDDRVETMEFN